MIIKKYKSSQFSQRFIIVIMYIIIGLGIRLKIKSGYNLVF